MARTPLYRGDRVVRHPVASGGIGIVVGVEHHTKGLAIIRFPDDSDRLIHTKFLRKAP